VPFDVWDKHTDTRTPNTYSKLARCAMAAYLGLGKPVHDCDALCRRRRHDGRPAAQGLCIPVVLQRESFTRRLPWLAMRAGESGDCTQPQQVTPRCNARARASPRAATPQTAPATPPHPTAATAAPPQPTRGPAPRLGAARPATSPDRDDAAAERMRADLDKETAVRRLRTHREDFKYCYEQQLLRDPTLTGTVGRRFLIAPTGAVSSLKPTAAATRAP
jgi:hypothetical protein